MPKYTVGGGSKVTVRARSRIHDTTTVWDRVAGEVEASAETLASDGATARFTVDMSKFDAGDWLKNRKLRKDFEMDAHPQATFELTKPIELGSLIKFEDDGPDATLAPAEGATIVLDARFNARSMAGGSSFSSARRWIDWPKRRRWWWWI